MHVQDSRGHYATELNPELRLRTTVHMFSWIKDIDLFESLPCLYMCLDMCIGM